MGRVKLEPGYYEWHLVDENGNVLLNITDSDIEDCVDYGDFWNKTVDMFESAEIAHDNGEELNGVDMTDIVLKDEWMNVVADTLTESYDADYGVQSVNKFKKDVQEAGFNFESLNSKDWCELYGIASRSIPST